MQHLYDWVRDGKQPFTTEKIEVKDGVNVTDGTGNAVGGYRLPFVEVPLCIYHPVSTPMKRILHLRVHCLDMKKIIQEKKQLPYTDLIQAI